MNTFEGEEREEESTRGWVQFGATSTFFNNRSPSPTVEKQQQQQNGRNNNIAAKRRNNSNNNLYSKRILTPISIRKGVKSNQKAVVEKDHKNNATVLISPVNMNLTKSNYEQKSAAVECIYGSPNKARNNNAMAINIPLSSSLSYTPSPKMNTNTSIYTAAIKTSLSPQEVEEEFDNDVKEQLSYSRKKGSMISTPSPPSIYHQISLKTTESTTNGAGPLSSTSSSWDHSSTRSDEDAANGYVATTTNKEHDSERICRWFLVFFGIFLCLFIVFLLSLMIGAGLRGESVSWKNILYGVDNGPAGPTATPSMSPTTTQYPTFLGLPPTNITVGAYYYPWHGNNFHGGKYLRKHLNQRPYLGEYDDTKADVIAQHLTWSRQANIRLWVTSWWGPNRRTDIATKDHILKHRHLLGSDHRIALFYETTGRIKKAENYTTQRVVSDIDYICTTYFDHPNYYRINGRPVLFLYLTRKLDSVGVLEEVILLMKSTAEYHGYDLFTIGDHVWQTPPSEDEGVFRPFLYLDAVTNYDVYGSMTGKKGLYAGPRSVSRSIQYQREWKIEANSKKCGFIPAVSPGFNDRGVRLEADHKPLSRKLTKDDEFGSLFQVQLDRAKYLVDDVYADSLLLVNSFNEWHEDTQIEPTVDVINGTIPKEQQYQYTQGLEYQGYGELYLDLLREATKDDQDDNAFIFTTQEDVSLKWAVEEPTTMSSGTVPTPLFQPSSHVP